MLLLITNSICIFVKTDNNQSIPIYEEIFDFCNDAAPWSERIFSRDSG